MTLGRALQQLGQTADARAEFEYVLSLAPDNLAAIRGLAEMHGGDDQASDVRPALPMPVAARVVETRAPEPFPGVESTPPSVPHADVVEAAPAPMAVPADGPDLAALDASIEQASGSQRAAQIERLEIWLARLEELRTSRS